MDNGSTDDSSAAIAKRFQDVRIIRLFENRGFTGGIAAAAGASDADALIFLNNDATPDNGWLDALLEALEQAPDDVVAVSGKMTDPTGQLVDFIGGAMTFDGHAFQRDFRKPLSSSTEPRSGAELLFACGGNMIVRRDAFERLGGFDNDYFAYLEDVDFGWRSWIAGYRTIYAPRALARHKSSATSDRLGAFERGVLFERNALQTAVKNFGDAHFGAALAPVLLSLLHRLHHYVAELNPDSSALVAPPLGERPTAAKGRWFGGSRERAVLTDPLARMQFRALHWFFANQERVMEKRRAVQKMRKRSDDEIFDRFPLHYVPTYHADERLFGSSLFQAIRAPFSSVERTLDDMIKR